jgi:hypothetical protein
MDAKLNFKAYLQRRYCHFEPFHVHLSLKSAKYANMTQKKSFKKIQYNIKKTDFALVSNPLKRLQTGSYLKNSEDQELLYTVLIDQKQPIPFAFMVQTCL